MKRKLASIARVLAKHPIEGADLIERLQVKGWTLVSGKDNFQVGDLCVYFEIDSFLPIEPEFEFLRKSGFRKMADGTEGFHLKTAKLRGVVSQGLALPIKEIARFLPSDYVPQEDDEITDYLGVKKFEAPIPAELAGQAKGMFPSLIPKTDEERVQNLQEMLDEINGTPGYKTLKIDGASMTAYLIDGDFGVCTRSVDLLENPDNSLWKVANRLDLKTKLQNSAKTLGITNIAIQGEIYGEGIQGNKLKKAGQHFAAFNLFDIDHQEYLDFEPFLAICTESNIQTVPILDSDYIIHNDIEKYIKEADLQYDCGSKAEGIVIRSKGTERWRGNRISFKSINPAFLLKYGE